MKFELHTTEKVSEASIDSKWIIDGTIEELKEFYSHVTDCCPVPACPTEPSTPEFDHTDLIYNINSPMLLKKAVEVYRRYSALETGNPMLEAIRVVRLKLPDCGVQKAKRYVEQNVMPQCV